MDFPWEVSSDQSGSDHFLILIKSLAPWVAEETFNWKLHKAYWTNFAELWILNVIRENVQDKNDLVLLLTARLTEAINLTISKSLINPTHVNKP